MKRLLILIIIIGSLMSSCITKLKLKYIPVDYATVLAPGEGGLRLVQYTRETENVYPPYVGRSNLTGELIWYAAPLIAVSPDGQKLAYIATSNQYHNLYLKDISGGSSTIQRTSNRNIMDMSYSPDGKYIAFTERKGLDDNIYMINATEGVAVQQLVASNADELSPVFTSDGKNLFFSKSDGSVFFIWSLNFSTFLLTQYTEGFTPSLTPDGQNLIITRNSKEGTRGEIWMVNIEKSIETLILNDPVKGYSSPRLSPDGQRIICVGTTPGDKTMPQNLDLFLVGVDGSGLTQLTFHGGHDVSPVWSTDGKSIYFLSQRGNSDGKYNVWRMELSENF